MTGRCVVCAVRKHVLHSGSCWQNQHSN